ncbi:uncharacterized protein BDZ83DRAFT_599893 [Colletotrichum acutatum]|uniref:Secreted protein n=1 Tax=Glomerella acutata TaxID=27357 RepID=A0AAD8XP57_GLOAC|nr:uncharacterized protein BDZ83DRAFT_599893 [Colletotrichum acutatum]KAK1731090.1 hypothetical protein BDZ83DRAFT_599893 [Colletotrichum acutatum]
MSFFLTAALTLVAGEHWAGACLCRGKPHRPCARSSSLPGSGARRYCGRFKAVGYTKTLLALRLYSNEVFK